MPRSKSTRVSRQLTEIYDALLGAYGPQHWWPGETPTEVIVGAILTQNTNWRNVERAIENLRTRGLLDWAALRDIPLEELAAQIRPAGYFNIKARRLKHFVEWLWKAHRGSLEPLVNVPLRTLREELLSINGIGPETADSILLYALRRPSFVVDAYTRRILLRHGLIDGSEGYEQIKSVFETALPADVAMFNEYHALIVRVAKQHCRKTAQCEGCPLAHLPHWPQR